MPVTTVEDAPVVAALPPLDVSDPVVVESQAAQPKRIIVIDAEEPFGDRGSDEPDAPAPKVTRSDSPSEAPAQRWKRAFDRRARVHTMSAARAAQVVDCGPEVVGETDDAAQIAPPIQQLDRDQAPAPRPGPIDEPAEVTIDDAIDDIGATTDASLMRRLQRAKVPDSFNRHDYAAYYDAVEEASVSIVRPVGPSTSAAASSAGSRPSAGGQPPVASEPRHNRVNRLLRGLTGRGD